MKRTLTVLTILLLTTGVFASPVSENGQLHVQGLQLTNECGYPVQLRGVSTHGLQWFGGYYNDTLLDFTAYDMGADMVRLAMYEQEGGYVTNPAYYTNLVNTLVDKIGARGMYALIDWHVLHPGDPNIDIVYARQFWTDMANAHKDKNFVIYEIANEPNNTSAVSGVNLTYTVSWAVIKAYADDIIPRIRAIDPDAVIICGTPNYSQLGNAVVDNPLSYANVMYAYHFYAGSHPTSMLLPYVNQLPIFVTEWGPTSASGDGGEDYLRADEYMSIMGGANSAGVTISWAEWSLCDDYRSSSIFKTNTMSAGIYDFSKLTTAGLYVYDKINNPAENFICGTATITPTQTPYAGTPTPTFTVTPTYTPLPWDLIYDGDTAGYTLADGVAVSNAWVSAAATPVGTITELAGGNPGNAIYLNYVTPAWWEGHSWSPNVPKTIGANNQIVFEVRAISGNVQQLRLILDRDTKYFQFSAGTSWTTMSVPLSQLYTVMPASINEIDFVCNYNIGYSVQVDNIRLVAVPVGSPTQTRTITLTRTITMTRTITRTHTISPTRTVTRTRTQTRTITPTATASVTPEIWTPTATITPTAVIVVNSKFVDVSDIISFPNPTTGSKVTFRYNITGMAEKLTINVYTFGERKIYSVDRFKVQQGIHTEEWIPSMRLANGLYYYTIEGINGTRPKSRHVKAFFVHTDIPTP